MKGVDLMKNCMSRVTDSMNGPLTEMKPDIYLDDKRLPVETQCNALKCEPNLSDRCNSIPPVSSIVSSSWHREPIGSGIATSMYYYKAQPQCIQTLTMQSSTCFFQSFCCVCSYVNTTIFRVQVRKDIEVTAIASWSAAKKSK